MADPEDFYDKPNTHQKHPHFEHRTNKLDRKNNDFTDKKFQRVRHVSGKKKLLHSLQHIGKNLNEVPVDQIPTQGLQKVCLILINYYKHYKHDPKIGALNDAYMFGLNQHRQGYNIFYLTNCDSAKYPQVLAFFLKYTLQQLTVYYSGNTLQNSIEFKDGSASEIGSLIAENYNGRCKAVFISDSTASGSVFNINAVRNGSLPTNIISLSANKSSNPDSKEGRRSHGIFTYYLCKIFNDCPNITPYNLARRMNDHLYRFHESFNCEVTDHDAENQPIFN